MSRSGYSEDFGDDEEYPNAIDLYRNTVSRAINGKRGQAFLRELADALDAMPEKRLIAEDLEHQGAVCAIGSVGVRRGIDLSKLDPEDARGVGKIFGIAECMAREIVFENDEGHSWIRETPEARWQRMRNWTAQHLKGEVA